MIFHGECLRPASEFKLTHKPSVMGPATFVAATGLVTRRLADLFGLPDETPVLAHWHGERRTDAFAMTAGDLRKLALDSLPE